MGVIRIWGLQAASARVLHIVGTIVGAVRAPVAPAAAVTTAFMATAELISAAGAGQVTENRETPLLVLVQALVEGICGVGQFLQGRAGVGHGCGALPQALDPIFARL